MLTRIPQKTKNSDCNITHRHVRGHYYDNRYMHFARQRDPTTGDMNSEEEPTNAENQDMKLQLSHTVHNGTES
jgi:hypothetical protein